MPTHRRGAEYTEGAQRETKALVIPLRQLRGLCASAVSEYRYLEQSKLLTLLHYYLHRLQFINLKLFFHVCVEILFQILIEALPVISA
jgi:hypothetical protein